MPILNSIRSTTNATDVQHNEPDYFGNILIRQKSIDNFMYVTIMVSSQKDLYMQLMLNATVTPLVKFTVFTTDNEIVT